MESIWIPVKVREIKPYTEDNGTVIDQKVLVEFKDGESVWLFDSDCKVSSKFLNKNIKISIEILVYKIRQVDKCFFYLRKIKGWMVEVCGEYKKLSEKQAIVTPYGLIVIYQEYNDLIGKRIVVYGRLDIDDVKI